MNLTCIITFNTDRFFEKQVELFRKNVEGDLCLIDNSSDYNIARNLRKQAEKNKIQYVKTSVNEADFSRSHAYACTVAYQLAEGYDTLLLADHDIFPTNPFKLENYQDKLLSGVQQIRKQNSMLGNKDAYYEYMQPVLLLINLKALSKVEVDFNPCELLGTYLDTGGSLYKIVMGNKERCHFFSERHEDKDGFQYSVIERDWIHFLKGSNWKNEANHEERITSLMELV